jgi:hypothetical protein
LLQTPEQQANTEDKNKVFRAMYEQAGAKKGGLVGRGKGSPKAGVPTGSAGTKKERRASAGPVMKAVASSLKKEGFYEPTKSKSERQAIVNKATTKPQRVRVVEQVFSDKKLKSGGVSLAVSRGEKLPAEQGAGLTAKGRAKYNRETGSNLKAPQPQGGARRDSFCARMAPAAEKSEKGSRARASMKRWNCPGW